MRKLYCIVFTILFIPFYCFSQESQLEAITVEDGLSQGFISDIYQTKDGFIWIATKDGLNRYDGHNFKIYTRDFFDSKSISGNNVSKIFEDSKGRLWIGTYGAGLNMLDRRSDEFHHLIGNRNETDFFEQSTITSIVESPDGAIWFTSSLVYKMTLPDDFPSESYPPIDTIPHISLESPSSNMDQKEITDLRPFLCLFLTDDNRLLTGNYGGLFQIDWETNQLSQVQIPDFPLHVRPVVSNISQDQQGNIWLLHSVNITKLSGGKSWTFKGNQYMDIAPGNERNSAFWISGNGQLYKMDPLSGVRDVAFKTPVANLNENNIRCVFVDRSGVVWLGGTGHGIHKYNPNQLKFEHFSAGNSIYSILEDKAGNIWTKKRERDYYRIDLLQNSIEPGGLFKQEPFFVFDAIQDQNGQFWASGLSRRTDKMFYFKKAEQTDTIQFYQVPHGTEVNFSRKFLEDSYGQIWVAGPGSILGRYDEKVDSFLHYKNDSLELLLGNKPQANAIIENKNGFFWIGTTNGLLKAIPNYDDEIAVSFELIQSNPANAKGLNHNNISCLLLDPYEPEKYLWVGTKGGGLNKMNQLTHNFEHFGLKEGLPNRTIYGMLADKANNMWLSTNQGLSKFDIKRKEFKNFNASDGLQSNEFNSWSYLKTKDGRLIFGGVNGINIFRPEDLKFNTKIPKVEIVELKINNESLLLKKELSEQEKLEKPYLESTLSFLDEIELAYNQNHISIEFAALDFTNPSKNLYKYQLEGVDEKFIESGNNRIANYAHLKPGEYLFKVIGSNNDGIWNESPRTLKIIIHPPWWQTNLAYGLYAISILGILFIIYRFQINRIKLQNELAFEQKEAERLASLDRLKTDFFSNITHEFRTPLTLIIDPLKQVLKNIKDESIYKKLILVQRNADKLLLLINQLLDLNKLEHHSMKVALSRGNFVEFLQPIIESFRGHAKQKGIQLDFHYSTKFPHFDFDTDKCRKVLYNLIGNAVKFTPPGGKITCQLSVVDWDEVIPIEQSNSKCCIEIVDNGIGIPADQLPKIFDRFYQVDGSHTRKGEGTGIGLSLTKELVELMSGNIEAESQVGHGSTFRVCLPMTFGKATINSVAPEKQESFPLNTLNLEAPSPEVLVDIDNSKQLILLTEDNADIRNYINQSLSRSTYQLIEASDGLQGLKLATEYTPDLIISDVMMPGLDGFELLDILKKDPRTSHIPVIMLTAKAAMKSKLKGLKTGAEAYLTKPFSMEELSLRIEKLLEQRQKWQAYFQQNGFQQTEESPLPSPDQQFIKRATAVIESNLADEHFGIDHLCREVGMSRVTLHRKLKALTNLSTSHFIRSFRLERAYHLLKNQSGNVSEIAFQTGFNSLQYFSKCFKEQYGKSPAEILR